MLLCLSTGAGEGMYKGTWKMLGAILRGIGLLRCKPHPSATIRVTFWRSTRLTECVSHHSKCAASNWGAYSWPLPPWRATGATQSGPLFLLQTFTVCDFHGQNASPHSSLSQVLLRLWGLALASRCPQKLPETTCSLSGLGSRLHLKTEVKCVVFPSLSQEQPIRGNE